MNSSLAIAWLMMIVEMSIQDINQTTLRGEVCGNITERLT